MREASLRKYIDYQEGAKSEINHSISTKEVADLKLRIKNISDLPTDEFGRRRGDESGQPAEWNLSDNQAAELIDLSKKKHDSTMDCKSVNEVEGLLFELIVNNTPSQNTEIISAIKKLLKKDNDPELINYIQQKITDILTSNKVTLSTLVLLGELSNYDNFKISDNLVRAIENQSEVTPDFINQFAVLNRLNTAEGNLAIHKILDYFESHLFVLQNDLENRLDEEGHKFYVNLHYLLLQKEVGHSKNYLVKKHLQDQVESLEQTSNQEKKGAISGVAGGTNDSTIYAYRHALDSYHNRISLGIKDGYPTTNPILKIAPGYYGYYNNRGGLTSVFAGDDQTGIDKAERAGKGPSVKNNPEFGYIYDQLNDDFDEIFTVGKKYADDSYKLEKLRDIWNFDKALKGAGENFFYDLSKIDLNSLHPVVKAELLDRNVKYLKASNLFPGRMPLNEEELLRKIFLKKDSDPDKLYRYKNLSKLHMRKKIEDDFGIDLTDYDFAVQNNFLIYLETRTVEEVEKLREFVSKHKGAGLKTFLSLESGGEEMGDKIIQIGESLKGTPEAADKLFAEYTRLVDKAEWAADEVCAVYEQIFFERRIDRDAVYQTILARASRLLSDANSNLLSSTEEKKEMIILKLIDELAVQEISLAKSIDDFKVICSAMNEKYHILIRQLTGNKAANYLFESDESEKEGGRKIQSDGKDWKLSLDNFDSDRVKQYIDFLKMSADTEGEKPYLGFMSEENFLKYASRSKAIIPKLEQLLHYQINIEKKLEQIIFGEQSAELPRNFGAAVEAGIEAYQSEITKEQEPIYLPVGIGKELVDEKDQRLKPIDSLAYLLWLQNQGTKTEVMVCDTIQEANYSSLYGLSPEEARAKAMQIGAMDKEWYQNAIDRLGLSNLYVSNYQEVEQDLHTQNARASLDRIVSENGVIQNAIEIAVQGSVKKRVSEDGEKADGKTPVEYVKDEIAFILSKPATKVGHEKELRYDIIAKIVPVYQELKKHLKELPEISEVENPEQALVELSLYLAYWREFPPEYYKLAELFQQKKSIDEEAKNTKQARGKAKTETERKQLAEKLDVIHISVNTLKGEIQTAAGALKKYNNVKIIDHNIKNLQLTDAPEEAAVRWHETGERLAQAEWFKKLKLPKFYYPKEITSLSFEIDKGKGEFSGFKEPYSSYKIKSANEMPIETNQVIVSTHPLAAAKLLVLSEQKQVEYCNKVLRPLLINYYIATSADKEEATRRYREDAENVNTISDLVRLIQEKIIRSIEERKKV